MSNAMTRINVAAALSTVGGVTGFPRRPAVMRAGDAWPQWRGSERAGGESFEVTWQILIVLPAADETSADSFADSHLDALADALRSLLFIDTVGPASIPSEGGDLYALMITGRSE
jgi:hypothetical protein